eukprot:scaffold41667_cov65-Phaeocystis_antarctica.AAC.3
MRHTPGDHLAYGRPKYPASHSVSEVVPPKSATFLRSFAVEFTSMSCACSASSVQISPCVWHAA